MDRRGFLKSVAAAFAAVYVPVSLASAKDVVDNRDHRSGHVIVTEPNLTDVEHPVFKVAMNEIRSAVPKGTFSVYAVIGPDKSDPLNQYTALLWDSPPKIMQHAHFVGVYTA